jgi:hypothetical protein
LWRVGIIVWLPTHDGSFAESTLAVERIDFSAANWDMRKRLAKMRDAMLWHVAS